jgi:hypothetical protein
MELVILGFVMLTAVMASICGLPGYDISSPFPGFSVENGEHTPFTFRVQDGGDMFLLNFGNHLQDCTASQQTSHSTS